TFFHPSGCKVPTPLSVVFSAAALQLLAEIDALSNASPPVPKKVLRFNFIERNNLDFEPLSTASTSMCYNYMTTKRVEVPFDSRICHKRPPLLSYLPISRCGRPGYICHSGMTMVSTMETKKNRFNTVDDYLDSIDDPTKRKTLERVRAIIKATVPDAEEHISYQLPAYHHHGALVYFGAWKSHWALYPLSSAMKEAFQSELSAYRLTKGGVQFPWDTRFPQRLVRQLIEKRITENLQAERENTAKKRNSIHCKTTIMEKRISTQKITPNLWFDNQAEDAARFYTSTFKNAQIGRISRYT